MTQIIPGEARPLTLARRGTSVSDWWLGLRNRILSSPRFQRWAARFPLTRLIARRRASSLFDLCAGFVYSQVLNATVRLRLLEELTAGPQTAAELAPVLALGPDAARRLLDAAAALRQPGDPVARAALRSSRRFPSLEPMHLLRVAIDERPGDIAVLQHMLQFQGGDVRIERHEHRADLREDPKDRGRRRERQRRRPAGPDPRRRHARKAPIAGRSARPVASATRATRPSAARTGRPWFS